MLVPLVPLDHTKVMVPVPPLALTVAPPLPAPQVLGVVDTKLIEGALAEEFTVVLAVAVQPPWVAVTE